MQKLYFLPILFLVCLTTFAQDTIYIYDLQSQSFSTKILPAYVDTIASDSTSAFIGVNGSTSMPAILPINTYPNTNISLLQNASDIYSTFNFPFTAVTRIKYGLNITSSIIGRRSLLVFNFDLRDANTGQWRNLHDCNPFFDNGTIQNGWPQLHPLRYYTLDTSISNVYVPKIGLIEVAEDIGDAAGYFGIAYDTTLHAYDSLMLYNLSYPAEGYPIHYSDSINGDTLCLKFGLINNPDSFFFQASWGGNGEYTSPFFDANNHIRGIRWSYNACKKFDRKDFYFLKYVRDSLATSVLGIDLDKQLNLYPVPATDHLRIDLPEIYESMFLCIANPLGQRIIKKEIHTSELIDVSYLTPGVYFAYFTKGNANYVRKFIKR